MYLNHQSWFGYGTTRAVFLTRRLAFKVPTPSHWQNFLLGLLGNMQERQFSTAGWPELCPVLFSLPGGFLVVMARAEPLTDLEWSMLEYERYVDREDYRVPVENKRSSFGVYRGKIVAIDYGN